MTDRSINDLEHISMPLFLIIEHTLWYINDLHHLNQLSVMLSLGDLELEVPLASLHVLLFDQVSLWSVTNLFFLYDFKKTDRLMLFLNATLQLVLGLKDKQLISKEYLLLILVFFLFFSKEAKSNFDSFENT